MCRAASRRWKPRARLRAVPLTKPLRRRDFAYAAWPVPLTPPSVPADRPATAARRGPVPEPRCHCSAIPDCTRRPPAQTGRFAAWPARVPGRGGRGPRREEARPGDVDRGFLAGVLQAAPRAEAAHGATRGTGPSGTGRLARMRRATGTRVRARRTRQAASDARARRTETASFRTRRGRPRLRSRLPGRGGLRPDCPLLAARPARRGLGRGGRRVR